MAGQLGVGERAKVALHGDVKGRRWLPLQDAVGEGALDCHCRQLNALQQRKEVSSVRAETRLAACCEVGGTGRRMVSGVKAELGVKEGGSTVKQHQALMEMGQLGIRPGGGRAGSPGGEGVGHAVEGGQKVTVGGIVLSAKPQLVVGFEVRQRGDEVAPQGVKEGELGGLAAVGAEEGGCGIQGREESALPSFQQGEGNQAGEPLHGARGGPHEAAEPRAQDHSCARGMEHYAPTTGMLPECSVSGQQEGRLGHQGLAAAGQVDLRVSDACVRQDHYLHAEGCGGGRQGLRLTA